MTFSVIGNAIVASAADADTLTITPSASTLSRGNPETLTIASTAGPIDSSGDGPYLYAVVQPAGAGGCQATYGSDIQVVGSQAVRLTPAGDQVTTGSDSSSYNYTSYTPGTYTACSWLESDSKDSSTSGDTASDVSAHTDVNFTVADTDAVSVSYSANPQAAVPVAVTFATQAAPIDSNGDGPYLYALLQPTSAGGCQSTYGTDLKVVGTQAVALTPTANVEVHTGADSHAYNYTSYTPGTYSVCSWLETDSKDSSTANDTSSVVTASNSSTLTIANTDTLAITLPAASAVAYSSFTITFAGKAAYTDASGGAPYLYAVAQPKSAGGCGATYGADLQAAGSQAVTEIRARGVASPSYSSDITVKPTVPGGFEQCAWLETDYQDTADANDTSSVVLASAGPVALTVTPAKVVPAPKLSTSSLTGLAAGAPRLAFGLKATAGTIKSIKVTLPSGISSRSAALLARYLTVTSGYRSISHTVTRSGSTLTITLKGSATSVGVVIGAKALAETAALEKAVKTKRTTKEKVTFTLTNSAGGKTTSTVALKV